MSRPVGSRRSVTPRLGKDGLWHAHVTIGHDPLSPRRKQVQRHIKRKTEEECWQAIYDVRAQVKVGKKPVKRGGPTVAEWANEWLDLKKGIVKLRTYGSYESHVRVHIVPHLGKTRLASLDPAQVDTMLRAVILRSSHANADNVRTTMAIMLRAAMNRRLIAFNPLDGIVWTRARPRVLELPSENDLIALYDASENSGYLARLVVSIVLGLRQGEALGLTWRDIDFRNNVLYVRRAVQRIPCVHGCAPRRPCGKEKARFCPERTGGLVIESTKSVTGDRVVPIPDWVCEILLKQQASVHAHFLSFEETMPVFPSAKGLWMDPRVDWGQWKNCVKLAGLRRSYRLHDGRHVAATSLLEAGVDPVTTMAILGWSSRVLLDRYQHSGNKLLHDAASKLRRPGR